MSGQTLNTIYELIEAENLEEARILLQPLLDSDAENPDVWWLYAHAVEDSAAGQDAIKRVASLSPDYPGLKDVMAEAGITGTRPNLPPPPGLPELPQTPVDKLKTGAEDAGDDYPGDFGDLEDPVPETESEGQLPIRLIAVAGIAVLLIGAILAILSGSGGTPPASDDDNTQVAQVATTDTAAVTESATATEDTVSDTTPDVEENTTLASEVDASAETETPLSTDPTQDGSDTDTENSAGLSEALAAFDVAEDGISTLTTSVGETLVVSICSTAGPRAATVLNDVMQTLAQETVGETAIDSLAVSLTDCDNDRILRSVSVTYDDASQYADGTLTEREFQGRWRPIDLDTP